MMRKGSQSTNMMKEVKETQYKKKEILRRLLSWVTLYCILVVVVGEKSIQGST